jgi:tellurium resistance protein TerD
MTTLVKGSNMSLTKATGGTLTRAQFRLRWQPRATSGDNFDPDAHAFMLGADGKMHAEEGWIFWGHMADEAGSVKLSGDDQVGGIGEDIDIDFTLLPADCVTVRLAVNIDQAKEREQNFGMITGASLEVIDLVTGQRIPDAYFDLSEDASTNRCMVFADIYRNPGNPNDIKLRHVAQGYDDGIDRLAEQLGLNIPAVAAKFGLNSKN